MSNLDNIRVIIRVRPLNGREQQAGSDIGWVFDETSITQYHPE